MIDKKSARLRRARRARMKMRELGVIRLSVHRTSRHIYAQVIATETNKVLAVASTVEKSFNDSVSSNIEASKKIGVLIAERIKAIGIMRVAFDRSGYKYHGRVKAVADSAREAGLEF